MRAPQPLPGRHNQPEDPREYRDHHNCRQDQKDDGHQREDFPFACRLHELAMACSAGIDGLRSQDFGDRGSAFDGNNNPVHEPLDRFRTCSMCQRFEGISEGSARGDLVTTGAQLDRELPAPSGCNSA